MEHLQPNDPYLPQHTIELCGPPTLQRDLPNRTFMYEQAAPYADTLDSFNRLSVFLHSGLTWSNYLTALPPITRQFYLNMPPTHSDYLETSHQLRSVLGPTPHRHQDPTDAQTPPHLGPQR